jgi:hypothetical protein
MAMTNALRRVCVFVSATALLTLSAAARGEDAEQVNTTGISEHYTAGSGIKLTDELLLHPKVEVQAGYQPNVFYEDDSEEPKDAGLTRFGAGFELTTASGARDPESGMAQHAMVELDGDVLVLWNQYISGEDSITEQSNLGANAMLGLKVNRGGFVEFMLRDGFVRAVNPPPAETPQDLARDKNTLTAGVTVRPGGGALDLYLNGSWTIDVFERDTAKIANRNMFEAIVGTRWQWLPKTQVSAEVSFGLIMVEDDAVKTDRGNSTPLRVTAGISSLITPKFGVVLRGGYGNGFYSEGPNFSSYLALGELRYAIGPTLRLAIGYSHDFADSLVGNFRADHAIYGRMVMQFLGRVTLFAKPELRLRTYEGIPMTANGVTFCSEPGVCMGGERDDTIFRLEAGFDVQVNDWLVAGVHYLLISDSTDAVTTDGTSTDSLGFVWQEVMFKATAKF